MVEVVALFRRPPYELVSSSRLRIIADDHLAGMYRNTNSETSLTAA